jgi:catechol 2,3-dioxygenase-like lactoylglutathione lyase family enzyme
MTCLLHIAVRVKNPNRSGALYADVLQGRVVDVGGPPSTIGVIGVAFGKNALDPLTDLVELWPADKRWTSEGFVDVDPRGAMFGHVAIRSDLSVEKLTEIAENHGVRLSLEERGVGYPVPIVYDSDGNFIEVFR